MLRKISSQKLYSEGKIFHNQIIEIENNTIINLRQDNNLKTFDFENLAPALIDLHINGGEIFHFTANPTLETLEDIMDAAEKNGTGYLLPTIITASEDTILRGIAVTKNYQSKYQNSGVIGMHLEGPFLNPIKRGAHLEKYLQIPTKTLIEKIIKEGNEVIKIITIAPELFDDGLIELLLNSDIKVSVGHSNATAEQAQHAFGLGINLVTHLFNAMSGFNHRQIGLAGASLMAQNVYAPIIVDGIHVDYEAVKLAYKLKKEKLFLISDALFQNNVLKDFKWEEFDAHLINNQYLNTEGNLAGATISLFDAVKNTVEKINIPLETALDMATSVPASLINTDRKIGKIENGYEARFLNFKDDLSANVLLKF